MGSDAESGDEGSAASDASANGSDADGSDADASDAGSDADGEQIDLEDPKQRRMAFLLEDLSKVESKYHTDKPQQAEAKPSNTTASTWKEASWSETHGRADAQATFKALDTDGDGNCHRLFHLSPKLCHLLFLVSRSCRHDHLSIEHLHQDHLNLLDET